ncbi:P-loop containing nucleoside triphosphate hydrolase protein [Suillus subalutaceus]|uniref:P-loop containing nucleoside triphosphate hydrolase protein n=1 Tax=Suillus subalutaceus TaxID=48586 RepID=UPI001B86ABBB|nr:P-loop containing nucleoside triphosphate hydrolase protein [Suillus subalutaceus]KAG1835379.1 P-loop containing nucleoside triphosphate hydrolase protein [Suillus subalutaceus]
MRVFQPQCHVIVSCGWDKVVKLIGVILTRTSSSPASLTLVPTHLEPECIDRMVNRWSDVVQWMCSCPTATGYILPLPAALKSLTLRAIGAIPRMSSSPASLTLILTHRDPSGNNAGHTIVVPVGPEKVKTTFAFHLLPSSLVNPTCVGLIGSGVVVHVPSFFNELDALEQQDRAHLVFDSHQIVDGLKEVELGGSSIGTTKKGIGPAYSRKASRSGLRFRKIVEGCFKRYGHFEYDTEDEIVCYKVISFMLSLLNIVAEHDYIHCTLPVRKKVLVEGANALMLDLDFGTYPYVTSSSTTIGGVCTGPGIPPKAIGHTIGVIKAYTTQHIGVHFQEVGKEYGTTTGRRRCCGWLDLVI